MAVPRAAAAYGRQLKNNDIFYSKNYISFMWISFCSVDLIPYCDFGLDLFRYWYTFPEKITCTSAHQTNGFRSIEAFKFVKKNIAKLTSDIVSEAKRGSIKLCFETICKIPYVNKFFANQILCDLLESKVLGPNATENIWICLGPGAKNGLGRIFGLKNSSEELKYTKLLKELCMFKGKTSGFEKLSIDFPTFLKKPLSLKNIEHGLCEFDKYFRYVTDKNFKGRTYTNRAGEEKFNKLSFDKKNECAITCILCGVDIPRKFHIDEIKFDDLCEICLHVESS